MVTMMTTYPSRLAWMYVSVVVLHTKGCAFLLYLHLDDLCNCSKCCSMLFKECLHLPDKQPNTFILPLISRVLLVP